MSALLQVALDFGEFNDAVALAERLAAHVHRIEVGTPLVLRFGAELVRAVKRVCPDRTIVADFKIVDAGEHEARIAFDAGADVVTVLACADDRTVEACLRAAPDTGRRVMADLIGLDDPVARAVALGRMGVDEVCLHTAADRRPDGDELADEIGAIRSRANLTVAVAGGIRLDTLPRVLARGPDVVIVGSAITGADDPAPAAARFAECIRSSRACP